MSAPQPKQPPLSTVVPPLLLGSATFNTQYVTGDPRSPSVLPSTDIVRRALELGVRGFDTSPYYGPAEELLGAALGACLAPSAQKREGGDAGHPEAPSQTADPTPLGSVTGTNGVAAAASAEKGIVRREDIFINTKCGRVASSTFDYSPSAIRASVTRSLARLRTEYLDLVFAHDVEFVSADEVVAAVRELRRIRDLGLDGHGSPRVQKVIRYVGISGYPVPILCALAERIASETGEPLDAVMSYGHFTLQNETLAPSRSSSKSPSLQLPLPLDRLRAAGVSVVLNASMLGMGLLTTKGVDGGAMRDWHPAPRGLRDAVSAARKALVTAMAGSGAAHGGKIEGVAIRWAMEEWARRGAVLGSGRDSAADHGKKVGISVMGVTSVAELEETWDAWTKVLRGLQRGSENSDEEWQRIRRLVEDKFRPVLGKWLNYSWESPGEDFLAARKKQLRALL